MFAQRVLTRLVFPKGARTAASKGKGRAVARAVQAPAVQAPPVRGPVPVAGGPVLRNINDPREALLHHAEVLVDLEKAKTDGLKAASLAFHTAVATALDAYQTGLEAHVAEIQFLVGWCFLFSLGALLTTPYS